MLVHIYLDGSVQISHGGIEMGQGLTTKLLQVSHFESQVCVEYILTSVSLIFFLSDCEQNIENSNRKYNNN